MKPTLPYCIAYIGLQERLKKELINMFKAKDKKYHERQSNFSDINSLLRHRKLRSILVEVR